MQFFSKLPNIFLIHKHFISKFVFLLNFGTFLKSQIIKSRKKRWKRKTKQRKLENRPSEMGRPKQARYVFFERAERSIECSYYMGWPFRGFTCVKYFLITYKWRW